MEIEDFIQERVKSTIRIKTFDKEGRIIGQRSGFLYRPKPKGSIYVITAGHGCPKKGSMIETNHIRENSTLLLNAGIFKVFHKSIKVDCAISKITLNTSDDKSNPDSPLTFRVYEHEFVNAQKDEAYGFGVLNNYEFRQDTDKVSLPLYYCYEVGMILVKQTKNLNYFEPARSLEKDEYYSGASGSPITDPEGAINSIFINRTKDKKYLVGCRLDNKETLLKKIIEK